MSCENEQLCCGQRSPHPEERMANLEGHETFHYSEVREEKNSMFVRCCCWSSWSRYQIERYTRLLMLDFSASEQNTAWKNTRGGLLGSDRPRETAELWAPLGNEKRQHIVNVYTKTACTTSGGFRWNLLIVYIGRKSRGMFSWCNCITVYETSTPGDRTAVMFNSCAHVTRVHKFCLILLVFLWRDCVLRASDGNRGHKIVSWSYFTHLCVFCNFLRSGDNQVFFFF